MKLEKRTYSTKDAILLVFKLSPVCAALNVLLSLAQAVMPMAVMALATANFVDTAIAILSGEQSHSDIYIPLVLLLGVLAVHTTIGAVIRLVGARNNMNLKRKLQPAVVEVNAALEFKHIENAESWELISRVSRDPVKSVSEGFGALLSITQVLISVASVLVLIITQVWWAAAVITVFSVPMFIISMKAGKKNYQAGRDAEKFNRRTDYLGEVLTGRENVDERTVFGYGGKINDRWYEQYEAGRILKLKVHFKMFLIIKGSSLMVALIGLLIALTLIGPVTAGDLSAGMFMGIMSAVFAMVNMLGWQLSWALENIAKVGEYMKDLTAFTELSEAGGAVDAPDAEPPELKTLEFRNVRFKYPTMDAFTLNGISFKLECGRHYAFVGRNGAGKTTITKLLTGLYTEFDGEILINGKELREYPASTLKAMFSVVYQDFARYYISVKNNIAIGDIAGSDIDSRISETARQAGLDEVIAELKNGLDTPLGKIIENGQDISGGQWQRIAIGRSLLSRAPLKILDEPTAALDPVSESRVYEEFEKLMRGKTTVFISHRLGSTKLADEILVLDGGRIAERGTHEELMDCSGQYAEMFEAQRSWYQ